MSPRANPAVVLVQDASSVGEARRAAVTAAARVGMNDTERGTVAIVATELAGNLARHARGGYLLARACEHGGSSGVEILAVDRGPGIADVHRSLRDGYSTAGTPGTGLGAVARLSTTFDVHSAPGHGTTIVSRVLPRHTARASGARSGVVSLPKHGEVVIGDGWGVQHDASFSRVLVVDGLGHGPFAAEAAHEAIRVFQERAALAPGDLMDALHAALRGTRGAAAAAAVIDHERRTLRFAGVGNIAARIVAPASGDLHGRGLVSLAGILGHQVRKVQVFDHAWPAAAVLVMHSDGVSTGWTLERYPGLASRHPALIAATLHRDHARDRDDVTVVAVRDDADSPVGS